MNNNDNYEQGQGFGYSHFDSTAVGSDITLHINVWREQGESSPAAHSHVLHLLGKRTGSCKKQ